MALLRHYSGCSFSDALATCYSVSMCMKHQGYTVASFSFSSQTSLYFLDMSGGVVAALGN